jgi:hypothetical protein
MSRPHKEGVLSRWSRRKLGPARIAAETVEPSQQTAESQAKGTGDANEADTPERGNEALVELPSIDELGPDSDFQGFMNPQVDDSLRRAALKKLFSDPHFNVTDGLDVYAEDYTKLESLTPAMVAGLKHTRGILFGDNDGDSNNQADTPRLSQDPQGAIADSAITDAPRATNKEDAERDDSGPRSSEAKDDVAGDGDANDTAIAVSSPDANVDESKA